MSEVTPLKKAQDAMNVAEATMQGFITEFNVNNEKFVNKGTKAAARRARVASNKLAKATKVYREKSIAVIALMD